jgi:tRNA(adenine34) deaminase
MTDENYMSRAIDEAKAAVAGGNLPIGALVVKDDKIVGIGRSAVYPKTDPSAHAELEAIRDAAKNMNSIDLSGSTLYGTLEPCSMCMGCAAWARVSRVVFGAYRKDVPKNPYEIREYESAKQAEGLATPIEIVGGVLRDDCVALLDNVVEWAPVK